MSQKSKQKSVYGIGVDIVSVNRMWVKLRRHGDKFARKILTSYEYSIYSSINDTHKKAQYVAKCWAVKEAFVKAMGTGFSGKFTWGNIGYFSPKGSNVKGQPRVNLSDDIRWDSSMINKIVHLSVSDETENVIAFVTIEERGYNV